MQARAGFGEFVGECRGDAVGSLEHGRVELVHVADHERDRHRFTQRPAEAEHDAADHAGLGVRQHDLGNDFPGGGAEAVGRLFQQRRRHFEHVAHHRSDERNDHDREDDAGRQDTDTHWWAGHQRTEVRHAAEQLLQRLLHPGGKDRAEHQQAPHAVDDGRHRRQQFNGRAQRALEPVGREFRQEERNTEAHRHRDHQRDDRSGQRAVDHDQAAVLLLDRIPHAAREKAEAVLRNGGPGADNQRQQDADEHRERQQRGALGGPAEQPVSHRAGARSLHGRRGCSSTTALGREVERGGGGGKGG